MSGFHEVIEGVEHWQAVHPKIGQPVHSYYLPASRTAIDPIGFDGLGDELEGRGGLERIVLTNRHHLRAGAELAERFGCQVLAPASGMHEFGDSDPVSPYSWGEELAPGVTAHEVGAICPDDGALHIRSGPGALAFADGVIADEDGLAFVPDFLMDDPEKVKREQLAAIERLLELDFDAVLLAHGEPIRSGGKQALREFVAAPRSASFG
jgi:glyoxylase-like metal-dependent hydrolase (beta-lactamase superfamily II)